MGIGRTCNKLFLICVTVCNICVLLGAFEQVVCNALGERVIIGNIQVAFTVGALCAAVKMSRNGKRFWYGYLLSVSGMCVTIVLNMVYGEVSISTIGLAVLYLVNALGVYKSLFTGGVIVNRAKFEIGGSMFWVVWIVMNIMCGILWNTFCLICWDYV